jgi:hypothetical protein
MPPLERGRYLPSRETLRSQQHEDVAEEIRRLVWRKLHGAIDGRRLRGVFLASQKAVVGFPLLGCLPLIGFRPLGNCPPPVNY